MDIKEILKDLKEFSDEGATEYGYEMPLSEVREVIKALERTRWIPVSERLPNKDIEVMVFSGVLIWIATLNKNEKWEVVGDEGIEYKSDAVTHWMPLPEPPGVE